MPRQRWAFIGTLVLALSSGVILWQAGLPQHPTLTIAPSFSALTLDQDPIHIDNQLQRPVVLNFWATWCLPCIIEMPLLEATYQAHVDTDLLVLGINAAEDPQLVQRWLNDHNIHFPVVIDLYNELQQAYKIGGYPTTFFIDRQGYVQKTVAGQFSEKELQQGLAAIGIKKE